MNHPIPPDHPFRSLRDSDLLRQLDLSRRAVERARVDGRTDANAEAEVESAARLIEERGFEVPVDISDAFVAICRTAERALANPPDIDGDSPVVAAVRRGMTIEQAVESVVRIHSASSWRYRHTTSQPDKVDLSGVDLAAILDRIVEGREDYVYSSPDNPRECVYTEVDGKPSCLIGHVLIEAGVPADRFPIVEGIAASQATHTLSVGVSERMIRALSHAQQLQDEGATWGDAAAAFHKVLDQ